MRERGAGRAGFPRRRRCGLGVCGVAGIPRAACAGLPPSCWSRSRSPSLPPGRCSGRSGLSGRTHRPREVVPAFCIPSCVPPEPTRAKKGTCQHLGHAGPAESKTKHRSRDDPTADRVITFLRAKGAGRYGGRDLYEYGRTRAHKGCLEDVRAALGCATSQGLCGVGLAPDRHRPG